MSADIEKMAIFDDRIVQTRPKFAVEKGALSVTNAPFNAIAANASQHTYNVLVPSENVFIDRAVDWTSTCFLQFDVTVTNNGAAPIPIGTPVAVPARDFALCAFPLQSLTTTMTATINDTTVTINTQDVLPQVLRLTDYKKNRYSRTCPTMLDRYQNYNDAFLTGNTPLNGYEQALNVDEVPNGAFPLISFTSPAGASLLDGSAPGTLGPAPPAGYQQYAYDGSVGIPVTTAAIAPAGTASFRVWFSWTSTEKLVLSPFVFADAHEWDTGLFGCQNIQFVMNLQAPSRVLRNSTGRGVAIVPGSIVYNPSLPSPFQNSRVNLQFLTPSLDISLPPKSVVPYMEFPRYISSQYAPIGAGQTATLSSQTITLPVIPDLLIVYCRPTSYSTGGGAADPTQGDWLLGINGVSVNFDNFAGLLSAHTREQLYKMSTHNGLEMDYSQWIGQGVLNQNGAVAPRVPLAGGMLVLKPGRDIVLQAGQAPSLVGNFVLQFQLTVTNQSASAVQPQIYVIAANSGFFETIKGSSRVVKGVLTEQDIISAPLAPAATHGALARYVGAGVMDKMGNAMSRMKELYSASKPTVSAVKKCLEGMPQEGARGVAKALGSVGYGRRGARSAHPLADRLME